MSKFSVKKPFTILVAVIIVVVMGVMSIMQMTPNLLPNIDLPTIMLVTAYPGATPEEVEQEVSKPLEQAMSTLENITQVQSNSNANYSMLTLTFTEDVDMNTCTVDILQKIEQAKTGWSDMVGTPTIMKINPSMMPVSAMAVSYDGKDINELSVFVDDTLQNKLEGINGIATVSASGNVTETVRVELSQKKLDKVNSKIQSALNKQFDDAQSEIDKQQDKLNDGKSQIESGKETLAQQEKLAADKLAAGKAEVGSKERELLETKAELRSQIISLQSQKATLQSNLAMIKEIKTTINTLQSSMTEIENTLKKLQQISQEYDTLNKLKETYQSQIDGIMADISKTQAEREKLVAAIKNSQEYKDTVARLAQIQAELAAKGITPETLQQAITQYQTQLNTLQSQLNTLKNNLSKEGISLDTIDSAVTEMENGIKQIDDGISQLENAITQIDNGQLQIKDAKKQLEEQAFNTQFQLSEASTQLIVNENALTQAQAQIDSALTQVKDAKKSALEKTDLNHIVTMDTLSQILAAQNFSMPAGYIEEDGKNYLISVGDKVHSIKDLKKVAVLDLGIDGLEPITVNDIANVYIADNADTVYANINGSDGILFMFSKQSDCATSTAAENVSKRCAELEQEYPGLHFSSLMDQGKYINQAISSIFQSLIAGAVFAGIILFLFLRDIKPTFIVICSIPISVMFAFALMYFSGVTLNMISMAGLAVSVGMLVDNSVVVIENIFRLRSKGVSAAKAAVIGTSQVAGSILASTLTTICVFAPIVFVQGMVRQIFTDIALTSAYALLASLIVAMTLVPAMSSRMMKKPPKQRKARIFGGVYGFYEKTLRWSLRFKPIVIIAAVVLLAGSTALALARGFEFMPAMSSETVSLTLIMDDKAELKDTRKVAEEATRRFMDNDEVASVGSMLTSADGSLMTSFFGGGASDLSVRHVLFYITVKNGVNSTGLTDKLIEEVSDLDGTFTTEGGLSMDSIMGGLTSTGITIDLFGDDLNELREGARIIGEKMAEVEGVYEIDNGLKDSDPEIKFIVDKSKAEEYGLTTAQVYQMVSSALTDEKSATTMRIDGDSYGVVVVDPTARDMTVDKIKKLKLTVDKQDGTRVTVPLSKISTIEEGETLASIDRIDGRRYIKISASVEDDYNVTHVTQAVQEKLNGVELPGNTTYEFAGSNEEIMDAMKKLVLMLLVGVLLIYLIMVAEFQSLKNPFIILFTIPLAFTGGFIALLITGIHVSVFSMMGFVMLCGIIVNNGIVLVDYVNQLRLAGLKKRDALVEAGKTRLRPILMTSITTILGLFLMALGIGSGNEMMQPVAVVCIGGLIYATFMTLYIVPIIYDLMNRKPLKRVKEEDLTLTAEEMMEDEFADYREMAKHAEEDLQEEAAKEAEKQKEKGEKKGFFHRHKDDK